MEEAVVEEVEEEEVVVSWGWLRVDHANGGAFITIRAVMRAPPLSLPTEERLTSTAFSSQHSGARGTALETLSILRADIPLILRLINRRSLCVCR